MLIQRLQPAARAVVTSNVRRPTVFAASVSQRFLSESVISSPTDSSSTFMPDATTTPQPHSTEPILPRLKLSVDLTKGHGARIAEIFETQRASTPLFDMVSQKRAEEAEMTEPEKEQKPWKRRPTLSVTEAFVNNIMKDGKKARARRTMSEALQYIQRQTEKDPHATLEEAVMKVAPLIKIVSTKRGAKNVATPTPLNQRQRTRFGIMWIVAAASPGKTNKTGLTFGERIGKEILAVVAGTSSALQKRKETHNQALQNRSNVIMVDRKMRRA